MPGYVCTSLSPFHRPTYVTDIPLEASDPWLGTRTGDGGTVILIQGCFSLFFGRSAWPMCTKCDNTKCLLFLVFPPWRAVWSYSPHLEVRYPIWGTAFIRRYSTLCFPGFPQSKVSATRFVYNPLLYLIITLIISRQTWLTWHSGQVVIG